jgi:hypothetical protein
MTDQPELTLATIHQAIQNHQAFSAYYAGMSLFPKLSYVSVFHNQTLIANVYLDSGSIVVDAKANDTNPFHPLSTLCRFLTILSGLDVQYNPVSF